MGLSLPEHPVFRDHKQRNIRIDRLLSCPPNAGDNFIITALTGDGWRLDDVNEWLINHGRFLNLEESAYCGDLSADACDRLSWMASTHPDWQQDKHMDLALCHSCPIMTHSVFSCDIGEIVFIDPQQGNQWMPASLVYLQWNLNRHYDQKPHMLWNLLQVNDRTAHLDYRRYQDSMRRLTNAVGNDMLKDTVLSYHWFIRASNQGRDPGHIDAFREYFTHRMFGTLLAESRGQFGEDISRWRGSWHEACLGHFSGLPIKQTHVSYDEFFFDPGTVTNSFLDDIPRHEVMDHSWRNLNLFERCMPMVMDEVRDHMSRSIDQAKRRLSA